MKFTIAIAGFVTVATCAPAFSQVVDQLQPGQTYLAVTQPGGSGVCGGGFCVSPTRGIPLATFATGTQLGAAIASVDSRFDALSSQMDSQFSLLRYSTVLLDDKISRAFELSAISASMGDAIPNPGDRYAVRVNMAGVEGYVAGSVGFSMIVGSNVRLSVNYGRGSTQNVVTGGMTLSWR